MFINRDINTRDLVRLADLKKAGNFWCLYILLYEHGYGPISVSVRSNVFCITLAHLAKISGRVLILMCVESIYTRVDE